MTSRSCIQSQEWPQ